MKITAEQASFLKDFMRGRIQYLAETGEPLFTCTELSLLSYERLFLERLKLLTSSSCIYELGKEKSIKDILDKYHYFLSSNFIRKMPGDYEKYPLMVRYFSHEYAKKYRMFLMFLRSITEK